MNIVINLDKPEHISSQQAVTKVKKLFSAKKAGHAGTLDPIATGVLVVCLNEATKITRFLSDLDKEYLVRLKLGERTDTYDATGRIVEKSNFHSVKEADIRDVLAGFKGLIKQIPPMYSAIKIDGQPLYKLARKGIELRRLERSIHIYAIDLISFKPPYLEMKVSCSKGTYIRSLCNDIGNALGAGAHMVSLRRTRVGNFLIEDSVSIEDLEDKKGTFYSMDSAISHLGEIILDEASFHKAKNGVQINIRFMNHKKDIYTQTGARNLTSLFSPGEGQSDGGFENVLLNQYIRLKSPENVLFGIGKIGEDNIIRIERLLN